MTILDTFYLLFKTDIPTAAAADIDMLDKKIAELAKKGHQRSEEEQKQLKTLRKQRLEATQDIKDQTKEVDKLGQSFVKVVEGITTAATAYVSFQGLKNGLIDAQKLNNALTVQAKLTGQNAGELRGYAQALENAGGSGDALLSFVSTQQQQFAASNLKFPGVDVALQRLHDAIKGKDITTQTAILGATGAQGLAPLLEQSDEEFAKSIESIKKHAAATNEASKVSREFDAQWKATGATFTDVFSKIDEDVLPILSSLLKGLEDVGEWLTGHEHVAEILFTGLAVGATALSGAIVGALVPALGAMGTAAAVAIAPVAAFLAQVGAIAGAAWVGLGYVQEGALELGDALGLKRKNPAPPQRSQSQIGQTDAEKQSYDFWTSQGYAPAQAAALVGNQKGEGWKNNSSVGDGGTAFGIAQWHPNRVQDILQNTGIDVRNAPLADQLKAQAWEMKNRYGITPATLPDSTSGGADFLVNHYEFSKNRTLDSMKRAAYAAQIAQQQMANTPSLPWAQSSQTIGGDRSTSVKIDNVNIQTQATDPAGIAQSIGPALQNEFRNTISNYDDGVST